MSHAPELCEEEIFSVSVVHSCKGRTARVSKRQLSDMLANIETLASMVLSGEYKNKRVLMLKWDGDDLFKDSHKEENWSFSSSLHWLAQMLTTHEEGFKSIRTLVEQSRVVVVYAMSTTSPYPPTPPNGLQTLQQAFGENCVYSVIAGLHDGPVASRLGAEIEFWNGVVCKSASIDDNDTSTAVIIDSKVQKWVKQYVDPMFGDGSGIWLKSSNNKESYDRYDKSSYGTYGYLLLGIAFSQISKPAQITYAGLGLVGTAECEFHRSMNPHIQQNIV